MRCLFIVSLLVALGCDGDITSHRRDGGTGDTSVLDSGGDADSAGVDSGAVDSGVDSGTVDSGTVDSGADSATVDSGPVDSGEPDAFDAAMDSAPPSSAPTLSDVRWLHEDISGWEVTSDLTVTFRSGLICLEYDHADRWPVVPIFGGTEVVGNAWVFIQRDEVWYGATWEWLRPGQLCKAMTSVAGDHIKRSPFDEASGWTPTSGEVLYFMVSGLARTPEYRNVSERTSLARAVWP